MGSLVFIHNLYIPVGGLLQFDNLVFTLLHLTSLHHATTFPLKFQTRNVRRNVSDHKIYKNTDINTENEAYYKE
jgi:hypothetical protein